MNRHRKNKWVEMRDARIDAEISAITNAQIELLKVVQLQINATVCFPAIEISNDNPIELKFNQSYENTPVWVEAFVSSLNDTHHCRAAKQAIAEQFANLIWIAAQKAEGYFYSLKSLLEPEVLIFLNVDWIIDEMLLAESTRIKELPSENENLNKVLSVLTALLNECLILGLHLSHEKRMTRLNEALHRLESDHEKQLKEVRAKNKELTLELKVFKLRNALSKTQAKPQGKEDLKNG